MRVVVASSDPASSDWLMRLLGSAGLSVVSLEHPDPLAPELVGCDLLIADHEAAEAVGRTGPKRRILLVPRGQAVDLSEAMGGGFMDLVVVPSTEDDVLGRVGRALDHFLKPVTQAVGETTEIQELKDIVERVTAALKASGSNLRKSVHDLAEGMLSVFLLLIDSHESTERGTPGHSRHVGVIARELALGFDRSEQDAAWMELAGRLHDIGLVPLGLPLAGEATLSLALRHTVEQHPNLSGEILAPLRSWGLPVDAIRKHHERIDGSGYPKRLKGDQVSLDAQILGAADVYEALTSPRPWRPAETRDDALAAMRAGKGFSEEVLQVLDEVTRRDLEPPGPVPPPPDDGPPPKGRRRDRR